MKIGLLSLGCPKNLVDSEVMLGLARDAGHVLTREAAEADVLVVNTCAFIDRAKQESIDAILEMAAHKTSGRCRRLIVTGCLAERYRAELQQEIPEIDVVLGTGDVPAIVDAVEGRRLDLVRGIRLQPDSTALTRGIRLQPDSTPHPPDSTSQPARDSSRPATRVAARHREARAVGELPTYIYDAKTPRVLTTPGHYAYVKVAEGCDYNCSFCIIPTLRGQYRSRPADSVVEEARTLAARGVKELILVSQDTTFYGIDRRERGALARLLHRLNDVEGLEWIRLLYLYPTTLTDDVLDAMAILPKVCKYVDLPLQHSSATVLARMRRPGHRATYEKLLDRVRQRVPGVTVRTTVIVGFPGETKAEFLDLCDFARTVAFDHLGAFTYSHEEGTAAHALPDDVPAREKERRRAQLMQLQQAIVERRHGARLGGVTRLLVDGPSAEHPLVLQGRLEGQAPEIDPVVYLTEADVAATPPGAMLDVEIVEARGYDLLARPLSAAFAV
jgi:ribosomal protein S12 methylthiotransferase